MILLCTILSFIKCCFNTPTKTQVETNAMDIFLNENKLPFFIIMFSLNMPINSCIKLVSLLFNLYSRLWKYL